MFRKLRIEGNQHNDYTEGKENKDGEGWSTDDSNSPRQRLKKSFKEKLQLCKKFMEHGYCPYSEKCKFAHGAHQLRTKNETNRRYKTKECGLFFERGHCLYGDRCNFKHTRQEPFPQVKKLKRMRSNFAELFDSLQQDSKLLRILFNSQ